MWILAILDWEVMEAELFREFFKIRACRIGNISPDNITFVLAKVADVSRKTVLSKCSWRTIQTGGGNHEESSPSVAR